MSMKRISALACSFALIASFVAPNFLNAAENETVEEKPEQQQEQQEVLTEETPNSNKDNVEIKSVMPMAAPDAKAGETPPKEEEKATEFKVIVVDEDTDEPFENMDLILSTDGKEDKVFRTDKTGTASLRLPAYGKYAVNSAKPEGYKGGVSLTIDYTDTKAPEASYTVGLKKVVTDDKEDTKDEKRVVKFTHIDSESQEKLNEGIVQILNSKTKDVIEKIDFSKDNGKELPLFVGNKYEVEFLETAKNHKAPAENLVFDLDKGSSTVEILVSSTPSSKDDTKPTNPESDGDKKPSEEQNKEEGNTNTNQTQQKEVKLKLILKDYASKEELKTGVVQFTSTSATQGDNATPNTTSSTVTASSFTVDFSKDVEKCQVVKEGDKFKYEFKTLPDGYVAPVVNDNIIEIKGDAIGEQTQVMYVMKRTESNNFNNLVTGNSSSGGGGKLYAGSLPKTGTAVAGTGLAGIIGVGAYVLKRKFR